MSSVRALVLSLLAVFAACLVAVVLPSTPAGVAAWAFLAAFAVLASLVVIFARSPRA